MTKQLLDRQLGELLEDLSRHQVATAGGSAAALSAAFAAALTTRVGRASRETWEGAGGAIAQSEALRSRLTRLAERNAEAFEKARALLLRAGADREHHGAPAAPGSEEAIDAHERDRRLAAALLTAAETPLLIAEAASDVAAVAAWAAQDGNADYRADAVVAVALAEAAARGASHLVSINLAARADGDHAVRAAAAMAAAAAAHAGLDSA